MRKQEQLALEQAKLESLALVAWSLEELELVLELEQDW
jgi:hypothetical protein